MDRRHVGYADLLPSMFRMNAGCFLIQLASEKDIAFRKIANRVRGAAMASERLGV